MLPRAAILFATGLAVASACSAAADPQPSLSGLSDAELLHVVRGGKSETDTRQQARIGPHVPQGFWAMPSREAALALVRANCSEETNSRLSFAIPEPATTQAPAAGEVGLRWEGSGSGPMAGGLKILRAAGEKSHFAYSAVVLEGEATKKQIVAAVKRTRNVALPPNAARHAYQVIWWLGQVRATGDSPDSFIVVNHESPATFWVTPRMSQRKRVRLHHQPGEHILSEFDADTHASFADLVMRETVKQQPHEIEDVTAVLGAGIYPDAGLKYLRTHTQPHSTAITSSWIDRTLAIAHAPEYRKWRSYAINNLVPWQEPMRFADERIDALLFAMARENLPSDASSAKVQKGSDFDTIDAVRALAWRDRVEIFPAVMTALRLPRDKIELAKDDLLAAAALLASRHAEFRPEILSYVAAQLTDLARSDHSIWALLNTVWRFEYHEVAALLQNLATASVDEVEDRPGSDSITRGTRRFHDARRILVSWNEPHPLTKLKLNALIEASVWNYGPPPELLRRQFESLAASEQAAFRTFIEWMKGQKLPFNWQPERAEWAISPEALAAAR